MASTTVVLYHKYVCDLIDYSPAISVLPCVSHMNTLINPSTAHREISNRVIPMFNCLRSSATCTYQADASQSHKNKRNCRRRRERTAMSLSTDDQVIIGCTVSSAVLSTLGSLLISYHAMPRKDKQSTPLNRLLLGLSLSDISNSSRLILAPLIAYPQLRPSPGCTTDGFFTILGFMGAYYNAALSYYYYAVVVRGMQDRKFSKWPERICHVVCCLFGFLSALMGIFWNTYNPNNDELGCYIAPYPLDCLEDETVPCERGELAWIHNYIAGVIPIFLVLFLIIFFNVSIYRSVRSLEKKVMRYDFARSVEAGSTTAGSSIAPSVADNASTTMTMTTTMTTTQQQQQQRQDVHQRSKKIAAQGFLYVFCFSISWLFVFIMFISNMIDPQGVTDGKYFAAQVLMSLFYPVQGFLNAIVYIRPRVLQWRNSTQGERSRCYAIWKACTCRDRPPPKRRPKTSQSCEKRQTNSVENEAALPEEDDQV